MSKFGPVAALAFALSLSPGMAAAQATEFSRGQTTVTVGTNVITVDNNVKYVNYTAGELLTVTLNYTSTCNILFDALSARLPHTFTPVKVTGTGPNGVVGTPSPDPATTGSVTFTLSFDQLKSAGPKGFGVAHLNLVLGVDEDCDATTPPDSNGIDETVTIGVQISASTASHP